MKRLDPDHLLMEETKPCREALKLLGWAARQYQHPFARERRRRCRFGTLPHQSDAIVRLSVQNGARAKRRKGRIGLLRCALDKVLSALCVLNNGEEEVSSLVSECQTELPPLSSSLPI
jgi:hypothetical protein